MDTTSSAVLTTFCVVGGKVAAGKPPGVSTVVGLGGTILSLSVLNQVNPKFAQSFGTLVVVTAFLMNVPAIAWRLNLIDHKKYPKPPEWGVMSGMQGMGKTGKIQ